MARQPNRSCNQQPCEPGNEDDVPPGGLAPAEVVGYHLPDEVDQVVDRRLEEDGRERDRHAEQRREYERPDVCPRLRVAHVRTLLRLQDPDLRTEEAAATRE